MKSVTIIMKDGTPLAGVGEIMLDTLDKTLTFTNEHGYMIINWLEVQYYGANDIPDEY